MQTFQIVYTLICIIAAIWLLVGIFNKDSNFNK